ncbi:hypothetical protein BVRB_8g195390 [Beta vulgaris subsp. vulgaris]|nr:hypothetical protein BVRB_8g195390 [Beta vulgaris subsp. vulgaris]
MSILSMIFCSRKWNNNNGYEIDVKDQCYYASQRSFKEDGDDDDDDGTYDYAPAA